jgi:hypothetical protein
MAPDHPLIALADIHAARDRIARYVDRTPLVAMTPCGLRLKAESLHPIGAFKLRGAFNAILSLSEDARAAGVVGLRRGAIGGEGDGGDAGRRARRQNRRRAARRGGAGAGRTRERRAGAEGGGLGERTRPDLDRTVQSGRDHGRHGYDRPGNPATGARRANRVRAGLRRRPVGRIGERDQADPAGRAGSASNPNSRRTRIRASARAGSSP